MPRQQTFPLRAFKPVSRLEDTVDKGLALEQAQNALLRPQGGLCGPPIYENLWEIGVASTVQTVMRNLTFSGTPVGDTAPRRAANKTIAVEISRQGKHFLLFYDLTSDECRGGPFYMGDDGTYTAGAYDFTAGTPTYAVLAVGLDADARWYGTPIQGAIHLGNGVDDNVIVQLARSATPGKWRKAASNATFAAPVVTLTEPSTAANVQPFLTLMGSMPYTADPVTDTFTVAGAAFVEGQFIQAYSSSGNPPDGLGGFGGFYVRNPVYDASTNSTTFQIALTSGGSVIDIIDAGTGPHACWNYAATTPPTAPAANLTITLKESFVRGAAGNDLFQVAISLVSDTITTRSTLTGSGTALDPYVYGITASNTAAAASVNAIETFINSDSKVLSFISASKSASDTSVPIQCPALALQNGSGIGVSDGFSSRTVTLYVRGWDPGVDGHGYEGPSSPLSNEVVIPATANNDLSVEVTCDPTAEGGRFGYLRLYMQFGEDDAAVWKLVDPDNPIPNSGTTATKVITTETEFGQDMSVDQNRPLPHKFTAFTEDQVFRAGLVDYPERLYGSKIATPDEIAPEGVSLNADDYDLVAAQASTAGGRDVTALIATESRLEFHTAAGFTIINPLDTSKRIFPQSSAGAMNQSAVCTYEGKQMYYLGADLQLRSVSTERFADFASTQATSSFAALSVIQYLKERVDLDAITRSPQQVWLFPDTSSQHLWMFLPGTSGSQIGFAYDLLNKGIVGPFSYPQIYGTCTMEPGRPEIIVADTAGRLFVWDTTNQMDQGKNAFGTQSAFTAYDTGTPMPARYNGYGYVDYDHDNDGIASRFYQAYETVIETAMFDLGTPGRRKAFQAALWRTIQDSRCFVEVTFIGLSGQEEGPFLYGDVNDSPNCRGGLALSDTAMRVKLRIIGAENKKWALRDLALLTTLQGQV